MPREILGAGKLPHELLRELLRKHYSSAAGDVVVGPRVGTDAAVLRLPDQRFLVIATDPITFATERIGWYAVHVNANDVAVCGAAPRWFVASVLLPPSEPSLIDAIFEQISQAAQDLDVAVVGGHTEVHPDLQRPIVVGTMVGTADRCVTAAGARPGDRLILCGPLAAEGTAILATERRFWASGAVSDDVLERARRLLDKPGISVVRPALLAVDEGATALHDVTEGGLEAAAWEMAEASKCGVRIWLERVPVYPETRTICEALGADPFRLLGSGSLLIAAPPDAAQRILTTLSQEGYEAAEIGEFVVGERVKVTAEGVCPLSSSSLDELARLLNDGERG